MAVELKLSDFIFEYPGGVKGPYTLGSSSHGICRVRLFLSRDGDLVVILTEWESKDIGPSVTNAAETIVRTLIQRGHIPAECRFIEHCERNEYPGDTFDTLSPSGKPSWETVTLEQVVATLACPRSEFIQRTLAIPRLAAEIGRIRQRLNPRIDLPSIASTAVIQRKLEVEASMVSKAELLSAVHAGAGEREMQQILRKDLSLLGEVYAVLPHEYICFSEFPIGDGVVDFLVFTGRSRMDIFLIEIKGAEFKMINSGNYAEFNAKINKAAAQIRRRYREIYNALSDFRQSFHEIRSAAEAGRQIFHSFLGPYTPLEVDPNKDINVYGVIIGGRMRSDLSESRHRHNYESHHTPPITIDSWDSWLNRLQRE